MSSNNYQYISGSKFYKGSTSVDSGFQEPIDTVGSPDAAMEINSYPPISRKGADMVDQHLQQQLASLKHQQQMQQQILLQQYQQQRQQLEQEHEKQLQEHIKYLQHRRRLQQEHEKQLQEHIQGYLEQQQQQKKLEQQRMEKEMMEKERLNQIKNKGKDEESAIASSEVKLKLQEFVLTKKHREAAAKDMTNSPPQFRHPWVPNSCSLDQSSPPLSNLSPPYPHPLLGKYDDDFPLRKTASEPNIYKVRSALKQKLETRRTMIAHSPLMVRRRDKGPLQLKRKTPMSIETGVCGSNPDSGPNSPSSSAHGSLANGSLSSLHSKEDSAAYMFSPFRPGMYPGTDLSLYTSPSMPNISLGRPPVSGPSSASTSSSVVSEEELRTALSARMGLPLAALLPSAAPCFFPPMPMIDSDFPAGSAQAAAYLAAQSKLVNPYTIPGSAATTSPLVEPPTHPAHRLHRHHRPLGRTHSAPLPLGHPGFTQTTTPQQQQQQQQTLLLQQQHEQYLKENQKLYLKQHIRQTVLQRAGSKGHMENVDEETEVKLAQEMKESPEAETEESKEENTTTKEPVAVAVAKEMKEAENKMEEGALAPSELEKQQREREAFLSQQREITKGRHGRHTHHRPLSRTQSSPLVTFSVPPQQPADTGPVTYNFTTGLAYDTIMLKHQCSCNNNDNHLEHAGRIQSIWQRLTESGLVARCERLRTRKATLEELQSCHTDLYAEIFGGNPYNRQRLMENFPMRFCILPCGGIGVDSDTVWNDMHTSSASRMAAGSVVELACQVAAGHLKNGVAIVRPPGHHAEKDQAMGFCYFNSIAIAAKQLREKKLNKILIVDWDVHHGNGTQQMFYEDPHVLYISIHRHDNGNFFPGTGAPTECGADSGQGFNINIAFGGGLNPPMGDAEYLTAFRTIVMPIAREFNPECVLVSAGFDAAKGHPTALGGYEVSPACFGHMTRELMSLAGGKVVLTLEGGYDIDSICEATEACVRALLGDELLPIAEEELTRPICRPALDTLETAIRIQYRHWPCVKRYQGTINQTLMEAQKLESVEADTVTALASLSMVTAKRSGSVEQESEPMEEGS